MATYYVRVNFDHYADPTQPVWLIKNSTREETATANGVNITVGATSIGIVEENVLRWYLKCEGDLQVVDGIAHITAA